MTAPYYIEVLSRSGEVLNRQRFDQLPVHIGRGYHNEFILDDAHTAERHAVLELDADGHLVMRDLGSQNGVVHLGKKLPQVPLSGSTVVRLGHTRLRVRNADFPVPPELADTTMHAWEGGVPALAGLALIALFTGVDVALSDAESFNAIRYLLVVASGLGAGMVWCGVWALANRLFGGHARFGRHLFILGSGLIAIGAWKTISSILAYAWSAEIFTRYGNLVTLALGCGMVFFHLLTILPRHPRRLAVMSGLLVAAGSVLLLMTNYQSTGRLSNELYMSVLLPPAVRQSPDHTVDDFMQQAGKLKSQADAAKAKTVKAELDDDDGD